MVPFIASVIISAHISRICYYISNMRNSSLRLISLDCVSESHCWKRKICIDSTSLRLIIKTPMIKKLILVIRILFVNNIILYSSFRTRTSYYINSPILCLGAHREDSIYENPKSRRGEFGKNPRKPFPVPAL